MSNGKVDDAEIDALLTGEQGKIARFLVTGVRELKRGQERTVIEVTAMRATCEQRGAVCPAMHGNIADQLDEGDVDRRAAAIVETARIAAETTKTAAAVTARLVADTAKKAATETACAVADEAKVAATLTIDTAQATALALADDRHHTWAMWGVSTTLIQKLALPVLAVLVTLWFTGKL